MHDDSSPLLSTVSGRPPPCGRFAPSPSGPLHFGSLIAALGSFLMARSEGGQWLLRIEDIDTPRVVPGAADHILHTLEAFGLYWDGAVVYQNQRLPHYQDALQSLLATGAGLHPAGRHLFLGTGQLASGVDSDRAHHRLDSDCQGWSLSLTEQCCHRYKGFLTLAGQAWENIFCFLIVEGCLG